MQVNDKYVLRYNLFYYVLGVVDYSGVLRNMYSSMYVVPEYRKSVTKRKSLFVTC
jgi:hypothetical protein